MKSALVIGSGFAGLAAASTLAHQGFKVQLLEKNTMPGGRAREFETSGFRFDMGPSWYWMPGVFERYFQRFGHKVSDFYQLVRLDPSYRIYFAKDDYLDIPANIDGLYALFESLEKGSSAKLKKFMEEAEYKYEVGINDLVYKPGRSLLEFVDGRVLKGLFKMHLLTDMHSYVRKYFKHPKLIQLLEFPVLFLGAMPKDTPALYSMMNYADLILGTWYPMGGMHNIVKAMVEVAEEQGVEIHTDTEVQEIVIDVEHNAKKVLTNKGEFTADVVVGGADYHHVEQHLLKNGHKTYSEEYWDKRKMAPSSLIFYLGVDKKLDNLLHHNLFFDEDFEAHAQEIYEQPQWPTKPLFYVSCTSKTDDTVAPEGSENLFILIPVAPDLKDDEETKEYYYNLVMARLEEITGQSIKEHVVYKRSYAHTDFKKDYNAYKGNAYGLANTLRQTAILKPSIKSKKIKNLYYTGQLTVPGPGVPPSLISGQVVAEEIAKDFKN